MMATPITKQSVSAFKCRSPMVTPSPTTTPEPVKALPTFARAKLEPVPFVSSDKPYNFLLVDDNIINLRIFGRILRKLFPKAAVKSVQDLLLLELTEELFENYDCVFLDIDMPVVTGIEIATKLRGFPTLDHVGLIAVTTRALLADMELYENIGFDHTFPKPMNVSYSDMIKKIEQVVSVRGALRAGTQAEKTQE